MESLIFVFTAVIFFVIFVIEILILALRAPKKKIEDPEEYHNGKELRKLKNHIEEDF